MKDFEPKMTVGELIQNELALFLGKVFCQGEIYGELTRSDYYGNKLITEDRLHEQTVKAYSKDYGRFLKQENESDIVRVPTIKY